MISGLLVSICVALAGCARSVATLDTARSAFAAGEISTAAEQLTELADSKDKCADVAKLDLAIADLASGRQAAAESRLRELRDKFDAQSGPAVFSEAASMLTDDTARRFEPASYEQVMIRAMLSVCSLAGDTTDAEAYALQAAMKQAEFAKLAEKNGMEDVDRAFQPIAMAPYLKGMFRESNHRDYDDAENAYRLVSHLRPSFRPAHDDIVRASSGIHSRSGHGVLYVIACVGRGPMLIEVDASTTTQTLTMASAIIQSEKASKEDDKDIALPTIASVKVPKVIVPRSDIAAVGVTVDGTLYGATQTLTDTAELAVRQNEVEMPWVIARAVARRVTKEALVATAADGMGLEGNAAQIFQFAAATAWGHSEKADTRCWGMLPREIQVLRAELPAGERTVALGGLSPSGLPLASSALHPVTIRDGANTYVIVVATDQAMYVNTNDR